MYNYSDILQEVSQNQATYGNYQKASATLHLFSPKLMPAQVLRPYIYNFGQGFMNDILTYHDSLQMCVAPAGKGMYSDNINQAILPDTNGILLDTYTLSQQWSFVLILDDQPSNRGIRNAMPGPEIRIICMGYTNTEPINPMTGTLNPNAVLIFTHTAVTYLNSNVGVMGSARKFQCSNNSDFVGEMNAQLSREPLFIGTPGDISNNVSTLMGEFGEPEVIGNYGDISLSNETADAPTRNVDTTMNSPKHQLGSIMAVMDGAINATNEDWVRSSVLPSVPDNNAEYAHNWFKQNAPGSRGSIPKVGLDTSHPMTISQLNFHYPNIDVVPHKIPGQSTWSVSPQDQMTLRNQMSSMVAASVTSFLPGCCLSDIAFRYCSWSKPDTFMPSSTGVWQIMDAHCLVTVAPNEYKRCIQDFQKICEMQLFPVLKSVHGEFDLMVYCNSGGEIVVDLIYLDDRHNLNPGEGFYETSARLGGLLNPMVVSQDNLNHNVTQLQCALDTVIANKLGPQAFKNQMGILEDQPVGVASGSTENDYANIF